MPPVVAHVCDRERGSASPTYLEFKEEMEAGSPPRQMLQGLDDAHQADLVYGQAGSGARRLAIVEDVPLLDRAAARVSVIFSPSRGKERLKERWPVCQCAGLGFGGTERLIGQCIAEGETARDIESAIHVCG
jgi:hypothetical protein